MNNHRGRVLSPRLPEDHSGEDPLPHGTLDQTVDDDHRIWVGGSPLPVSDESMAAAGWEPWRGSWFPPGRGP